VRLDARPPSTGSGRASARWPRISLLPISRRSCEEPRRGRGRGLPHPPCVIERRRDTRIMGAPGIEPGRRAGHAERLRATQPAVCREIHGRAL